MTKNYLFLDIDGVLRPEENIDFTEYNRIIKNCEETLKKT